MSQLINCSRCGTLFIKKQRDICDACIKEIQNLQENIIEYVEKSPLEKVHINTIIEHFKISMKEMEPFLIGRKLAPIENKIVFTCIKCNSVLPLEIPFSFVCKKCTQEMKQEVLKILT